MSNIPIFDSLTHPTITGDWIMPRYPQQSRVDDLLRQMDENNIQWAFTVGMKGIGGYDETAYIQFISRLNDSRLFPVAYFDVPAFSDHNNIDAALGKIKEIGYKGIKMHPRFSGFDLMYGLLPYVISKANDLGLAVLFCTYFYDNAENSHHNSSQNLIRLLSCLRPSDKVILLHGGAVRLLEFMEIARAFSNVLLDLSFTLCRYEGSSLDTDIAYIFRNFDRRICIGTDHPQFSCACLRKRFEFFTQNLDTAKAENIASKNLLSFIKD